MGSPLGLTRLASPPAELSGSDFASALQGSGSQPKTLRPP